MKTAKLTAELVAKKIGIPTKDWPGNCATIADALLKSGLVSGVYQYGLFHGPISDDSELFRGRPFTHHAWILDGDYIIDPTRWVFEGAKPYIYVEPISDEYDMGGNLLRRDNEQPPPAFDASDKCYPISGKVRSVFCGFLKSPQKQVSRSQLFWLSNLSLFTLGDHAKIVYEWLVENGMAGFIPIDNSRAILGD